MSRGRDPEIYGHALALAVEALGHGDAISYLFASTIRDFDCPYCSAVAGDECVTSSGNKTGFHSDRLGLAILTFGKEILELGADEARRNALAKLRPLP